MRGGANGSPPNPGLRDGLELTGLTQNLGQL
jgi:hypothetical protein